MFEFPHEVALLGGLGCDLQGSLDLVLHRIALAAMNELVQKHDQVFFRAEYILADDARRTSLRGLQGKGGPHTGPHGKGLSHRRLIVV